MPFHLQVFLDVQGRSNGELYWDDGDSLDTYKDQIFTHLIFGCYKNKLKSMVVRNSSKLRLPKLENITVVGLELDVVKTVKLNGTSIEFSFNNHLKVKACFISSHSKK
jgi:hypothetical protein